MLIRLSVTRGPHQGREFTFREHDTFLVGRSAEVHFPLPDDPYLSRLHFLIEVNPPLCHLQDLGSHNGTLLNGEKIHDRPLHHGDEISVGRTVIRVEIKSDTGEPLNLGAQTLTLSDTGADPAGLLPEIEALRQAAAERGGPALADAVLDYHARQWELGKRVPAELIVRTLPKLVEETDLVVQLIAQELELRQERGEPATLAEYQQRFPLLASRLDRALANQQQVAELGRLVRAVVSPETVPAAGTRIEGEKEGSSSVGTVLQATVPTPAGVDWSAPASALPVLPGFQVLERLGEGGMGVVYRALDLANANQTVAIKTIRPAVLPEAGTLARFLREVEILSQLTHPHIVGFRGHGESQGLLYFVMDYVEGTNAENEVRTHGPLEPGRAVAWVIQLLEGLEFAHAKGFVHRDIKPANVLIRQTRDSAPVARGGSSNEGQEFVRLADFGLARTYVGSQLSGLTCNGTMGGTVGYVPPEQILSFREVKPASDQYSAAATLYNLLTGEHIYDRDGTVVEMFKRVLSTEPIPLASRRPGLPAQLTEIVHRALQRKPEARYPDVATFRAALLPFARRP
jgi:serine/threonine-protein kinase